MDVSRVMMKTPAILMSAIMLATPLAAQNAPVIYNPCERGPVPQWDLINSAKTKFADFLQEVRPAMPRDIATLIAFEVCDDLSLVSDSEGLTSRLSVLLHKHGY